MGIIIRGYILFSTKGPIRVDGETLKNHNIDTGIDCIYAGYISEIVVHSKIYNHHKTKFAHYMTDIGLLLESTKSMTLP